MQRFGLEATVQEGLFNHALNEVVIFDDQDDGQILHWLLRPELHALPEKCAKVNLTPEQYFTSSILISLIPRELLVMDRNYFTRQAATLLNSRNPCGTQSSRPRWST